MYQIPGSFQSDSPTTLTRLFRNTGNTAINETTQFCTFASDLVPRDWTNNFKALSDFVEGLNLQLSFIPL